MTLLGRAGWDRILDLVLAGPLDGDWWRPVTTQFVYANTGYEVAALAAIAIFGILLERRHGWWAPLVVFLIGGTLRDAAGRRRRRAQRRHRRQRGGARAPGRVGDARRARAAQGPEDDADLLGVLAIAALLVLLPVATEDAHALAGLGGGLAGIVMGIGLARLR